VIVVSLPDGLMGTQIFVLTIRVLLSYEPLFTRVLQYSRVSMHVPPRGIWLIFRTVYLSWELIPITPGEEGWRRVIAPDQRSRILAGLDPGDSDSDLTH
jgi:hypothetical protein